MLSISVLLSSLAFSSVKEGQGKGQGKGQGARDSRGMGWKRALDILCSLCVNLVAAMKEDLGEQVFLPRRMCLVDGPKDFIQAL